MEEVQFPPEFGENQESLSQSVKDAYTRLVNDYPELRERWEHVILDTDPYGRLFGAAAAHSLFNYLDGLRRRSLPKSEQNNDDQRLA